MVGVSIVFRRSGRSGRARQSGASGTHEALLLFSVGCNLQQTCLEVEDAEAVGQVDRKVGAVFSVVWEHVASLQVDWLRLGPVEVAFCSFHAGLLSLLVQWAARLRLWAT